MEKEFFRTLSKNVSRKIINEIPYAYAAGTIAFVVFEKAMHAEITPSADGYTLSVTTSVTPSPQGEGSQKFSPRNALINIFYFIF